MFPDFRTIVMKTVYYRHNLYKYNTNRIANIHLFFKELHQFYKILSDICLHQPNLKITGSFRVPANILQLPLSLPPPQHHNSCENSGSSTAFLAACLQMLKPIQFNKLLLSACFVQSSEFSSGLKNLQYVLGLVSLLSEWESRSILHPSLPSLQALPLPSLG